MSEKIYAWLLRLHPSGLRKVYGEEALQLFRDRARDERGFLCGLRLWLDLLRDLAVSLPREYRFVSAGVAVTQVPRIWDGTPLFHTLEAEAPSFRSLFYGGVASLAVYGSILVLIGHGGNLFSKVSPDIHRTLRSSASRPMRLPTITLSYSPRHPAPGSTVNLTAMVRAVGGPTATGDVRFFDGVAVLKIGELDNGTATVTAKLAHSGTHLLRATYLGDANYSAVSSVGKRE